MANVFNEKIMEYVKNIGFDKTTLDDSMKAEIHSFLEEAYPEAKKQAAVQCYIQKYTDDNANNAGIKALKEYGYLITEDDNYSYTVKKYYYNRISTANPTEGGKLGLVIAESYHEGDFQITVDSKIVMNLFADFYKKALGA